MGDRIFGLGVNFAVTVMVARYLGPEDFGIYTYAISTAAIFASAGHMGLSGLVVREIVRNPLNRGEILGTTFTLKFLGMALGYIFLLVYSAIYEGVGSLAFFAIAIAGAVLLVKPSDIFDFWFQAFVQAKYSSIARLTGLCSAALLKVLFVTSGVGVIYFAGATLFEALCAGAVLFIAYWRKSGLPLSSWRFDLSRAKELLGQGWLVYLGSIFAVINLKIDQVMLRWMDGAEAVGIYGVAVQLSEAWYFVPTAIVATFFPKLIKLKEDSGLIFEKRLQHLFDLLFVLAFSVALTMSFVSEQLIEIFFGAHYADSAAVLVIHIWAAIFVFMRAAFSKWILIENALIFSLITQGIGAVINVVLNIILIPRYGVEGAAYATLFSYACSSFFSLALYSKTRPVFFMMLKSLFTFYRYLPIAHSK
jgi:O-antigen/teichoic acid export membrane protein